MKKIFLFLLLYTYSLFTSAGVVDTLKVHSDVMNRDIPVVVVRPSSTVAQSPAKGKKSKKAAMPEVAKCPVVYLLHGEYQVTQPLSSVSATKVISPWNPRSCQLKVCLKGFPSKK